MTSRSDELRQSALAVAQPRADPRLADSKVDAAIDRDGYAVVRLLSRRSALDLSRQVEECFENDSPAPNQPDSNWYLGLIDPDRRRVARTTETIRRQLLPVLQNLFTDQRCQYASVAIKPAGAGPTPFHQHWVSTVDPFARRLSCWILLSEGKNGAGTFRVVPQSHQLVPFLRHEHSGDYFSSFVDLIDREFAVDLVLQPGEAVIFEESILHATGPNPTRKARIAGIANFIGKTMRTAVARPIGDGRIGVFENQADDPMQEYLEKGRAPSDWKEVASFEGYDQAIDEAQFRKLIADRRRNSLPMTEPQREDQRANPVRGLRSYWRNWLGKTGGMDSK